MKATKFNIGVMISVNGRVKVNQDVTAALGKQMTLKQAIAHAKQLARGFVSASDFVAIDIFADNHHEATVEAWKDGRKVSFDVHEIAGIIKVDEAETPTTPETETAMTTTDNVTTAITNELNARNDKSAWNKAVTTYALELVETLDNWDKQPESVAELREMMLNGASDWHAYSWGGSSLIYNGDIAERCCTPSELKRVTNKNGLRDMANAREHWLDVQARALYQAANLVCNIANNYFNA